MGDSPEVAIRLSREDMVLLLQRFTERTSNFYVDQVGWTT
jgi:hypothetical protein